MEGKDLIIGRINSICSRVRMCIFGHRFNIKVEYDKKGGDRIFLQLFYQTKCTKTGEEEIFRSRKWYLSEHMTDQEILGTLWLAFEIAVKHELMEGFKVDGTILFNPHVNFNKLLEISNNEVTRSNPVSLVSKTFEVLDSDNYDHEDYFPVV